MRRSSTYLRNMVLAAALASAPVFAQSGQGGPGSSETGAAAQRSATQGSVGSQAAPTATKPGTATSGTATTPGDTTNPYRDNDRGEHNFGWVGLLGLAGLIGLARRGRPDDRTTTTNINPRV